jgi:hypothetical protein
MGSGDIESEVVVTGYVVGDVELEEVYYNVNCTKVMIIIWNLISRLI